jgi:hypothetical protein
LEVTCVKVSEAPRRNGHAVPLMSRIGDEKEIFNGLNFYNNKIHSQ